MSKMNLQETQRNRNATANFVNLIRTSTVHVALNSNTVYKLDLNDLIHTPPLCNLFIKDTV